MKLKDSVARAAAILFLPAAAGVIGGELGPGAQVPMNDKITHFTAYFVLALLATVALKARLRALWATLALIAMGGALEIVQGFVGRDCDIMDEVANSLGAVGGWLLGWALVALLALVARRPAH